jgi:hypothetical protein
MREYRSSGSVEGVKGNHDSYSNSTPSQGSISSFHTNDLRATACETRSDYRTRQ